mgnify:CR=1 FL=1
MPAIQLTPAQRKEHRAAAHHLDPVVMIGGEGLTPAVRKEIDAALKAHGLIKVRVFSDERETREQILATLAEELNVNTWRQWSFAWDATPGRHELRVRATEQGRNGEIGPIQTDERAEPFPSGATGHHQIVVIVR